MASLVYSKMAAGIPSTTRLVAHSVCQIHPRQTQQGLSRRCPVLPASTQQVTCASYPCTLLCMWYKSLVLMMRKGVKTFLRINVVMSLIVQQSSFYTRTNNHPPPARAFLAHLPGRFPIYPGLPGPEPHTHHPRSTQRRPSLMLPPTPFPL